MNGITFKQFRDVMNRIYNKHHLIYGRSVKYVNTSYDFRTMTFWKVNIRTFYGEKIFSTTEKQEAPPAQSIYEEIIKWLSEAERAAEK